MWIQSPRSPREGEGNPIQCSYLENSMDRGDWQAKVHEITESDMTEHTRTQSPTWLPFNPSLTSVFAQSPIVLPVIPQTCQVPTSANFHSLFSLPGSSLISSHTRILMWIIPHSLQVFGQMSPPLTFPSAQWIQNIYAAHLPSSSLFILILLSSFLHTSPAIVSYNNLFILFLCVSPTSVQTLWRWRHFLFGSSS